MKIVIESRIDDPGRVERRRDQIVRAAVHRFAAAGCHRATKMGIETHRLISDPLEACIDAGDFPPVDVDPVTFRLVFLAHGWALEHGHFAKIVTLDPYIEEGLDSPLEALPTPAGRRHWQALPRADQAMARAPSPPPPKPAVRGAARPKPARKRTRR